MPGKFPGHEKQTPKNRIEEATRKWWFSVAFILLQGLAFCLMTPVYLALLILFYPGVNIVTLRITGLVGLMLGLYNMAFIFGMGTGT